MADTGESIEQTQQSEAAKPEDVGVDRKQIESKIFGLKNIKERKRLQLQRLDIMRKNYVL